MASRVAVLGFERLATGKKSTKIQEHPLKTSKNPASQWLPRPKTGAMKRPAGDEWSLFGDDLVEPAGVGGVAAAEHPYFRARCFPEESLEEALQERLGAKSLGPKVRYVVEILYSMQHIYIYMFID